MYDAAACIRGGGGGVPIVPARFLNSINSRPRPRYSNTAAPRYSYTPYETPSQVHALRLSDDVTEVYIGGDLEPRETLRHVATMPNGIRWFMGASRDGVGVERLKNYKPKTSRPRMEPIQYGLAEDEFAPFNIWPSLYLDPDLLAAENAGILQALVRQHQDSERCLAPGVPKCAVAGHPRHGHHKTGVKS